MKRISVFMITLALCFSMSACGQADNSGTENKAEYGVKGTQLAGEGFEGQAFDLETGTVRLNLS